MRNAHSIPDNYKIWFNAASVVKQRQNYWTDFGQIS